MTIRFSALAIAATVTLVGGPTASVRGQSGTTGRLTFTESSRTIVRPGDQPEAAGNPDLVPLKTALAIAFSPDGKTLALSGEDPAIRLRDSVTNRARGSLAGHTEPVFCLAFSPGGKVLASGGGDQTVRLWDPAAMAERKVLKEHAGSVLALAFSPDGKILASGGQDKAIVLWDVAEGRKLATLAGHTGPVRALAFSPDGATLASAGSDLYVRLWDVGARSLKSSWEGHRGVIYTLAFSPDGGSLATAGEDRTVRLWDVATGRTRTTHEDNADTILALAFSPKGNALVAGSSDGRVRIWSPPDDKSVSVHRGHQEGVTALAFNPSTGALVTAGYDRAVKEWLPGAAVVLARKILPNIPGRNAQALFSPDGRSLLTSELASQGVGAVIRIWDTSTWKERGTLADDNGVNIFGNFTADGRRVVTTTRVSLRLWDAERLTPIVSFTSGKRREMPSSQSPDSSRIAYIDETGAVVLRDIPAPGESEAAAREAVEQKVPRTLVEPEANVLVQQLGFAPDGKALVVTSVALQEPNVIFSLRDVSDGHELTRKTVPGRNFARVFFAPDGKSATGVFSNQVEEGDTTLIFWSSATWDELARMTVPSSAPTTLAFSPDGSRFVLASRQGTVYLWDANARKPLGQFIAHEGVIVSVFFSPDGRSLATASTVQGEPVKIWDLVDADARRKPATPR